MSDKEQEHMDSSVADKNAEVTKQESHKSKTREKTVPESQYQNAVDQVKKALELAKMHLDRADEMTATAQRLQADFDNYRRRNADAVSAARKSGQSDVIMEFFPSLDVFESALNMITDENVKQGVRMVKKKFMDSLADFGVEPIPSLGCDFDPEFHEALDKLDTGKPEDSGKVVAVLSQGYRMGDKILKHSLVRVGK